MGTQYNPFAISENLSLVVDAGNPKSFGPLNTSFVDISGNNNTGSVINGAFWGNQNAGTLNIGSNNGFAYFPTNTNLDFGTGDFTIDINVSIADTNYPAVFCASDLVSTASNTKWWLGYSSNAIRLCRYSTTDVAYASWTPISNVWYNIIVARVSGVINIWINGVAQSVTNSTVFSGVSFANVGLTVGAGAANTFGSSTNPFTSPVQAQAMNAPAGTYYFKPAGLGTAYQIEYQPRYFDGYPWCCVFRSPYGSTATTNLLGNSLTMKGLLVQRDTLDWRAAVYWNSNQVYNTTSGLNADSGWVGARKVMLGYAGGHGIYNSNQTPCGWSTGTNSLGAGYTGSTCGSFPNTLYWGTGYIDTSTYANRSGTWSHWIYWTD